MSLLQIVNDMVDFPKINVGEIRLIEGRASITDMLEHCVLAHFTLSIRRKVKPHVSDRTRYFEFPAIRLAQSFADSQQSDRQRIQAHAVRKVSRALAADHGENLGATVLKSSTPPTQVSIEKIAKSWCRVPNSELV